MSLNQSSISDFSEQKNKAIKGQVQNIPPKNVPKL